MKYRLCLLTHGDALTLDRTIESFAAMVTPRPADLVCVVDGEGGRLPPIEPLGQWGGIFLSEQRGFCGATAALWQQASKDGPEHIFYLENDFEIVRPVDLARLAEILDADPALSQLTLMRDAVNDRERRAGGLFESYEGAKRWEQHDWGLIQSDYVMTTNPSLMRRAFMWENPWPEHEEECEGKFGIELREKGYRGAVYGDGSPWCRHIGVRTGKGY